MKKVLVTILVIFSFFIMVQKVNALERCEESENHKTYMLLSDEEKKKVYEPDYCKKEETRSTGLLYATNLPSRFSSRDLGIIKAPKNQGNLGTCWAFSAMATVSANSGKNGVPLYNYSEAHLLYGIMAGGYSDEAGKLHKYNRESFSAAPVIFPPSYFFNNGGMLLENEFKYYDYDKKILSSQYPQGRHYITVKSYTRYLKNGFGTCSSNEINFIKQAVYENGAVQGTMYIENSIFSDSAKNYYLAPNASGRLPNHAIVIVGWDDTISKSNFRGATRDGAWIIKNSFGSYWSGDGYFYISYDDYYICNDIGIYGGTTDRSFDNTYKTADLVGGETTGSGTKSLFIASIIDKQDYKPEMIQRVTFGIEDNHGYKVYLSKTKNKDNPSEWTLLGSGSVSIGGIISIDIDDYIIVEDDFMIIIEYTASSKAKTIFACASNPNYKYATFNQGRNYILDGNQWYDLYGIAYNGSKTNCAPNIWVYTSDDVILPIGVKLNKANTTIEVGKSEKVVATITPDDTTDKTLSWKSSDNSIATVDSEGNITGVKKGKANITVSTSNGIENVIKVTVKESNTNSITFLDNNLTKNITDKPFKLNVDIDVNSEDYTVTYTSSNTSVATVSSSGEVTIKGKGTTKITASVLGATDEITIDVISPITSVSFNKSEITMRKGDKTTLSVTYSPSDTNDDKTLVWMTDNPSVIDVDMKTGEVTALNEGQANVIVQTRNYKTASYLVEVKEKATSVSYKTHVQTYGWQNYVSLGNIAGTTGLAKRLEGIKIKLVDQEYEGNIEYRTHIQTFGWEKDFKKNDEMSGTTGLAKRLEAIEIKLTGEMANHYDIYYQVHAQKFGWLGWAKNGERSGTAGFAYRLEAIIIKLIPKGQAFTETSNLKAFYQN